MAPQMAPQPAIVKSRGRKAVRKHLRWATSQGRHRRGGPLTADTQRGTSQRAGTVPGKKGLKPGALGFGSGVVIGVASTAPAYSLAAVLGFLAGEVGLQSPAVLIAAFFPMLCVALAFAQLNRAEPDCGTTFCWVTRALGPWMGWMGGWGLIVACLVGMASLAQIAGRYTFLLFGLETAAGSDLAMAGAGVLWIALMTWLCLLGIEVSARTQWLLLAAELTALAVFAAAALLGVYADPQPGAVRPALEWLYPLAVPSASAFAEGLLLALFIYWGWDTALSVNEESRDPARAPGRAAVASTLVLVVTYVLVAFAAQAYLGPAFLRAHPGDALSALGARVLEPPLDRLLLVAVLASAAASTLTTILPAARTALSMAVRGAVPARFATIHVRHLTPSTATLWVGALAAGWYAGLAIVSRDVLFDSLLALGLLIAFYYGLTGFACPIFYRRELRKSARNLLALGVAPLLGAGVLAWAFVEVSLDLASPASSASGAAWLGLGPPLVIGLGLLLLGVVLMLVQRLRSPAFFERHREAPGDITPATARDLGPSE